MVELNQHSLAPVFSIQPIADLESTLSYWGLRKCRPIQKKLLTPEDAPDRKAFVRYESAQLIKSESAPSDQTPATYALSTQRLVASPRNSLPSPSEISNTIRFVPGLILLAWNTELRNSVRPGFFMHRTVRFFLYSAIAVFTVLTITFIAALVHHAPMPIGGRVAGVQIQSVFIPGRSFSCTQAGSQDRCQVSLFDRPLELNLTSTPQEVKQCQVTYAGQTATCKGDFHRLIIGGWMPVVETQSNLGLTTDQQATLREEYPQRNFLMHRIGESRLLQLATEVAIAAGVLTFLSVWLIFSSRLRASIMGGAVLSATWIMLTAMIWSFGYVD